jgi:GntR family transcriptional regulator
MRFQHKKVPLYYQLENILREKIRSGELAEDEKLPTENELIEQYGVSRITVRQALSTLVKEGLVERIPGRGTFVTKRPLAKGTMRLTGFIEDTIGAGMEASAKVLDVRLTKADWKEAEQLHVNPGDAIWCIKRVRSVKGTPYAYAVSYLPKEIGQKIIERDLSTSVLKLLEEEGRAVLGEATMTITGALADAHVASLLSTAVGAALLSIESTFYEASGKPVQYVRGLYRSDLYGYTIRLTRGAAEGNQGWYYTIASRQANNSE